MRHRPVCLHPSGLAVARSAAGSVQWLRRCMPFCPEMAIDIAEVVIPQLDVGGKA